jgi:hypothetical protein
LKSSLQLKTFDASIFSFYINTTLPSLANAALLWLCALGLCDDTLNNLFKKRDRRSVAVAKNTAQGLLRILGHHVNLDVDGIALDLVCQDNSLLRVCNQHNLPPSLIIVDLCNSQAGSVNANVSLVHNITQSLPLLGLEAESESIAIRRHGEDLGSCVDVALDKVAAHAGVSPDGALQVHMARLNERAEVGDAQRLRGDADGEGVLGEGSNGQADTVDGDGVALVAVCEEVGSG